MGLIKNSRAYDLHMKVVWDEINEIEKIIMTSPTLVRTQVQETINQRLGHLRQYIQWLDEDKEDWFESVDRALEDR